MLIVVRISELQKLVEVVVRDQGATFGDLIEALGMDIEAEHYVDGSPQAMHEMLRDRLFHGSVISDVPDQSLDQAPGLWLEQIAGTETGWAGRVRTGPNVLGRSQDVEMRVDDAALSGRHCRLISDGSDAVQVTDLGSRNGIRLGGSRVSQATFGPGALLWAGAGVYRLRRRSEQSIHRAETGAWRLDGTVSFNRPPRRLGQRLESAVQVPPPVRPMAVTPVALSVAAVLTPIVTAGAMVLVLGSLRFAMFAILSPLVAIGTVIEARARARKESVRFERDRSARIQQFEALADRAGDDNRADRWRRQPDMIRLLSRLRGAESGLWERRSADEDALVVAVGVGDAGWQVPTGGERPDVDLENSIDRVLTDVPIEVSLRPGEVVGIVGSGDAARSLARAMVLAAVATVGPADLGVVVVADQEALADWGWCAWLAHTHGHCGGVDGPWVLARKTAVDDLARLAVADDQRRFGLLIVDAVGLMAGRQSAARTLWSREVRPWGGVILAERHEQLPAECTCIIDLDDDTTRATVEWPATGEAVLEVQVSQVSNDAAVRSARAAARLRDPDVSAAGSELLSQISLSELGSVAGILSGVTDIWSRRSDRNDALTAPVGICGDGEFAIDLVADGPHVLVAGTTGSGKSEFLVSLVVSLALGHRPQDLNFVLIDYKGGSAFDSVSELPHVVGLVTDLDQNLGPRALVCLEAELKHRESILRDRGVSDISSLAAGDLARLVVIVDEFATMASEMPTFLDSLISVAQRGRSLGVHLVLATQRPAGAISDNIRANTDIRIVLRVQDATESVDVVGADTAVRFDRTTPGRAAVRLGPDDVEIVQFAHVTGPTPGVRGPSVEVIGTGATPFGRPALDKALEVVHAAHARLGSPILRCPWPDPLPKRIDPGEVDALASQFGSEGALFIGAVDEPMKQRRRVLEWNPRQGNLLMIGTRDSGMFDALSGIAIRAMERWDPTELHLHAIELRGGTLGEMRGRDHVGGVVGIGDSDQLHQLVHHHRSELDLRLRDGWVGRPRLLLIIDHLGGLAHDHLSQSGHRQHGLSQHRHGLLEDLTRVFSEGASVGIHTVAAADRSGAIPVRWRAAAAHRWLFGVSDQAEYQIFGLDRARVPDMVRGRGIEESGLEFQIAEFDASAPIRTVGEDHRPGKPKRLRSASAGITADELEAPHLSSRPWRVPVGLSPRTLESVTVNFHNGEHLLIAGPPRSGVSTALDLIAGQLCDNKTVLRFWPGPDRNDVAGAVEVFLERCRIAEPGIVVVIDDAHLIDDHRMGGLVDMDSVSLVVAGGRADRLRRSVGHWTQLVRVSGVAVLLRPDHDLDGDLVRVRLPRAEGEPLGTGRGFAVCDGHAEIVQMPGPTTHERSR